MIFGRKKPKEKNGRPILVMTPEKRQEWERKDELRKLRRKKAQKILKERKQERERVRELEKLKKKREKIMAEGSLYEAQARKKKAKKAASWQLPSPVVRLKKPRVKIRKRRQRGKVKLF